jgi:hypothetical protein
LQEESPSNLVQTRLAELLFVQDHCRCSQKGDDTVADITKHDGKQEGERDDCKQPGVDLLVRRHTVRVDDRLEPLGKLVCPVESWGSLVRPQLRQDGRDRRAGGLGRAAQGELDRGDVARGYPTFRYERLAALIVREQVERLVDLFFPPYGIFPRLDPFGNLGQLDAASLPHVVQDLLNVLESRGDVAQGGSTLVLRTVNIVQRTAHRVGHLADLGEQLGAVGKDDKDVFVGLFARGSIDKGSFDLCAD